MVRGTALALALTLLALCGCAGSRTQPSGATERTPADIASRWPPVAAYVSGHSVLLAGAAGQRRLVMTMEDSEYDVPQHLLWSPGGRLLAWLSTDGELYVDRVASHRVEAWPCPCGGLTFIGERPTTIENDASALLSFNVGSGRPARTALKNPPPVEYPEALVPFQDGLLIGGGLRGKTGVSGGPSHFYAVTPQGHAEPVAVDRSNSEVDGIEVDPAGREMAYVSTSAGGVCDDFSSVAIFDSVTRRIDYPAMPPARRAWLIPWLRWTSAGNLQALFEHSPRCGPNGESSSVNQPVEAGVWTLRQGRWTQTSHNSQVSESKAGITARLTPGPNSAEEYPYKAVLSIAGPSGAGHRVASGVSELELRPDVSSSQK